MTDGARSSADTAAIRAAYDLTAAAWDRGPRRIYDLLANMLLDRSPIELRNAIALDAGAGTGAATAQLVRRGARVTAIDLSGGMLSRLGGVYSIRPTVAVGDITRLPVRTDAVDVAVAAFVLNHLPRPAEGLTELARVTRPGGAVLASVFGQARQHPSKDAIDAVAARYGYAIPSWYSRFKSEFESQVSDIGALATIARQAGLADVTVRTVQVDPQLTDQGVVAWRTGMAHLAPFIAAMPPSTAKSLRDDALAAVSGMPPLELTMVTLIGTAS